MRDPKSILKRLASISYIFIFSIFISRYFYINGFSTDVATPPIIALISLTIFIFLYLYSGNGKLISEKTASWLLVLVIWLSLNMFIITGSGLALPIVVIFPLVPVLAIMIIKSLKAISIFSVLSILAIGIFIYLELIDYNFLPTPISGKYVDVMRGIWLIFVVIVISIVGWYFRNVTINFTKIIQSLAETDSLTELANRRLLDKSLLRELSRIHRNGGWLSILLIDIDGFKQLNDSNGHQAGDKCLVHLSNTIRKCVKRANDVVGRFGGDEFMAIMPDTSPEDSRMVAEQIRKAMEDLKIKIGIENNAYITTTIGCVSVNKPKIVDAQSLVRKADELLYKGKAEGRNIVISDTHH